AWKIQLCVCTRQDTGYIQQNYTLSIFSQAISEFPEDIFTVDQRRQGAVLLHVLCAIYMFHALAIVCDVYFVPSLEKVSENLQLSQDVAGATFMAAGSSAPELFTSLIGVFITKGDVGVGTIVGSAVFNILVIIGICGIFAGQPIGLSWWPLFRDAVFYILSIVVLILVRNLYSKKLNSCVVAGQDSGVVMVDELLNSHPHQLTLSEASLRLLITPHFPPFTRLRMAGCMVISERQRLIRARVGPEEGAASGEEGSGASGPWGRENGTVAEGERQPPEGERERGKETVVETCGGGQPKEEEDEEEEQENQDEENVPFKPFVLPDGWRVRLKWLLSWPVSVLLYCSIPDCNLPRWERWYLLTFLSSTLWIAFFSYLMVWMVTIISYTLGIPDVIMGITFLAAGTSVPDCMASLIVARQGMGDMAVSNSIGSNIFDVLLGLGFPWALRTLIVSYGSVTINSKGLVYSVILLLASVTLTVSSSSPAVIKHRSNSQIVSQ
uniref:Solute carrier family 24 member 6a n=2 Tax=Oreochromis niloticus TaxID=8128 RepID=I3JCL9_ORENI